MTEEPRAAESGAQAPAPAGMKRLHIVVPYRDRKTHLDIFAHLLRTYFARDKVDRHIPYRVTVVEQEPGQPFNRGMLANIGFRLGQSQSDYTCVHDVDYTPIWADYSWSDAPAVLLWYGAESRPINLQQPERRVIHKMEDYYSGVVLVPNNLFLRVNGFANDYWGWGYEDMDLKNRFASAGIHFTRRKGTYNALDHDSAGFQLDGSATPAAEANGRRYNTHWASGAAPPRDGLSTLSFEILDRRPVPVEGLDERPAPWEIVTVRFPSAT